MGTTRVRRLAALRAALAAAVLVTAAGCAPAHLARQAAQPRSGHAAARPLVALLPMGNGGIEARVSPPSMPRDLLTSDDGALRTAVGVYRDCSGISAIPANQASLWTCVPGRLYFVGHNPGVFTPLMRMHVGDRLTYADAAGAIHRYQIVRIESWGRADGFPPPASSRVVAQLQTCITRDGWSDRIVDVVEV